MKLGFLGTGVIAGAFIEGLEHAGGHHDIVVSPRSEAISRDLEARFARVRRAGSNAEVIEASEVVVLAMRPAQVEDALAGLAFRPGQALVSFVTGLDIPELQALAPGLPVARALPLPAVARCSGPLVATPETPLMRELLSGLGEVIFAADDTEMMAMGGVSALMATYFELQQTLIGWSEAEGVERAKASRYTRAMLLSLAETGMATPEARLGDLVGEHQTKGGLNQRVRTRLLEAGWFDAPGNALAEVRRIGRQGLE
ncbi:hypothetical protein EMQ25_08045 [Arsenicitalea aurantiaca]|uniref:Pyrroline-5-carboxylate reductase catalytic N-terminal domain-containing protein n=1 Tax=Arsenicitalea aurantiaca TaxID=1783274 RepID=A0A433XG74_9HYPH|nr:NAD(P)-binding domain-containing protein [Arsenicitalea aurantiaca]RUT33066.1 hypothetical protein EMQ25_08045 [Arsenicitalea aurantiaca]